MRLSQLEPWFVEWYERAPTQEERQLNPHWPADHKIDFLRHLPSMAGAHGVCFLCPKGFASQKFHRIEVFFNGSPVPSHLGTNSKGKTVRWTATGTGIEDLTLLPSVQEESGDCLWHGHVTNGEAA